MTVKMKPASTTRHLSRAFMIALCAIILLASSVAQERNSKTSTRSGGVRQTASRREDALTQLNDSLQRLARRVSPAVVQIEVAGFGLSEKSERKEAAVITRQHGIGAGVIVDSDGYIMTNAHVVEGAQRIRVIQWLPPTNFEDVSGSEGMQVLNARVIGVKREADLALLKVDAKNLPTVQFRLDRPQPGELVFAIGSPDGLQNSISMGVISSAWRQPDPENPMAYLQTDAPINAGNSGGPLVDVNGAVVGLNTFILSTGGGSEGLGFAIPARVVDFVYQNLKKYGHVPRVEIGVMAQTITPTIAEGLALKQNRGVVISDVLPGGPADAAGIKPGDIVLAVDGHTMLSLLGFTAALYQHSPDQEVKMDVLRGAQKLSFEVPGISINDRIDQLAEVADPAKAHVAALGIMGMDLDPELRSAVPDLRIGTGVVVIAQARGFNSTDTGLRAGDVIHSVNRTTVESVQQLKAAVAQLEPGASAVLQIERRGQLQYLAFEIE